MRAVYDMADTFEGLYATGVSCRDLLQFAASNTVNRSSGLKTRTDNQRSGGNKQYPFGWAKIDCTICGDVGL
uniref:Uncharacterized protein n=1 Tax=Parascaris equorum TaxID=6256 RepID=A0A914RTR4_PAREQ